MARCSVLRRRQVAVLSCRGYLVGYLYVSGPLFKGCCVQLDTLDM